LYERSSAAAAADRIAAHPLHCNIFLQIMSYRDKSELDVDLDVRLQAEALEAVVELDVAKDSLMVYLNT